MRNRRRIQRRGPLVVYHKDEVSVHIQLDIIRRTTNMKLDY